MGSKVPDLMSDSMRAWRWLFFADQDVSFCCSFEFRPLGLSLEGFFFESFCLVGGGLFASLNSRLRSLTANFSSLYDMARFIRVWMSVVCQRGGRSSYGVC